MLILKLIYFCISLLSIIAGLGYVAWTYFVPEIESPEFKFFTLHGFLMMATVIALPFLILPTAKFLADLFWGKSKPLDLNQG